MTTVWINDKRFDPSTSNFLAEGGEAEIYTVDKSTVLKLYKSASHPQFKGPSQQAEALRQAAEHRIGEQQTKLRNFPGNLPPNVVAPLQLARATRDSNSRLVGYTMPGIQGGLTMREFSQVSLRETGSVTTEDVLNLFIELHATVSALHAQNVVIGDFNPMNVLVAGGKGYLLDSDSMQFDRYWCNSYCVNYVDPTICTYQFGTPIMSSHHHKLTDWYAFAVLFWECLLCVHPYGGVYKPQNQSDRLNPSERPGKRISVLHHDVKYPAAAIHYSALPTPVLQFYRDLLEHDARQIFPLNFLQNLKSSGGVLHLVQAAPVTINAASTSNVVCRRVFTTTGTLIHVCLEERNLKFVYHENDAFYRENGTRVLTGELDATMRFRIQADRTIVSKNEKTFVLSEDSAPVRLSVDLFKKNREPVFDSNRQHCFHADGGYLWATNESRSLRIDEVFSGQTRLAAGPEFGFGYCQAGEFRRCFLFDTTTKYPVDVSVISGALLDCRCFFSSRSLWLFTTVKVQAKIVNRCFLIDRKGDVLASAEAEEGDDSWLGNLKGKAATSLPDASGGNLEVLLVATSAGIVEVARAGSTLSVRRTYAGTTDYAQPEENLLASRDGLYIWNNKGIRVLTNGRDASADLRKNQSTTRAT